MTAKVTSVQTGRSTAVIAVTIVSEDGRKTSEKYTLLLSEADRIPAAGEMLQTPDIDRLKQATARTEAYKKALSILSYGDNSIFALRKKLFSKGVSRENADFAVERVIRDGYIREDRQLDRAVVLLAHQKHLGPLRIAKKLSSEGYRISDISAALSRMRDAGELNFEEEKQQIVLRFTDTDGIKDRTAIQRELRRLGYIK